MTGPVDKTPGGQARVIFRRETRHEYVGLLDAIDEALAELHQQVLEHLPDYMAQRDGGMLWAEWAAARAAQTTILLEYLNGDRA